MKTISILIAIVTVAIIAFLHKNKKTEWKDDANFLRGLMLSSLCMLLVMLIVMLILVAVTI